MAPDTLALLGGPRAVTCAWPPYPVIDHREVHAATEVLMARGLSDIACGPFVARMEDAYAEYFGARYCLSFGSGTAAIHSALFALGVGPGAEVLTCNHNWISAMTAILHAGGTPVLCDTAPGRWHIDPEEIRRKATPHTKAVVVTHLWGIPADMDAILRVTDRLGLPVVEDVSHAHGSKYKGRYCGTIGKIGAFSLQGSKAITGGEAGFMLTEDERCYQRALVPGHHTARLGNHITDDVVRPFAAGGGMWTYRIAPIAAAIATEQLKKLPALNGARQANFDRLGARLRRYPFITWPSLDKGSVRGWYGTPALYDAKRAGLARDTFVRAVAAEGVPLAGEGYRDWSQIPLFADLKVFAQLFVAQHANGVAFRPVPQGAFTNYERVRTTMLLFPMPPLDMPRLMAQYADAIDKVLAQRPALRRWEREQAAAQK